MPTRHVGKLNGYPDLAYYPPYYKKDRSSLQFIIFRVGTLPRGGGVGNGVINKILALLL